MGEWITKRVGLCVELQDAFTNLPIKAGNVRIQVNGCPPATQKENRYYLFHAAPEEKVRIWVRLECYEEVCCEICPAQYAPQDFPVLLPEGILRRISGIPFFSLLLCPSERYELPPGYIRSLHETKPFAEVRVIRDSGQICHLAENYQGGKKICFISPRGEAVMGGYLRIESRDKSRSEDFTLAGRESCECCVLDRELNGMYEKGSRIYELYCARADETGRAWVITDGEEGNADG